MKLKHTTKKSANRSFDTRATGYASEAYRKHFNKHHFSPDKGDSRFTKPKRVRQKIERTTYPTY